MVPRRNMHLALAALLATGAALADVNHAVASAPPSPDMPPRPNKRRPLSANGEPHQGKREMARRVRQMERDAANAARRAAQNGKGEQ